jgi:hypothetical protein
MFRYSYTYDSMIITFLVVKFVIKNSYLVITINTGFNFFIYCGGARMKLQALMAPNRGFSLWLALTG